MKTSTVYKLTVCAVLILINLRLFANSALIPGAGTSRTPEEIKITCTNDTVKVIASSYRWFWIRKTDRFKLQDGRGRQILAGPHQPVVLINRGRNTPAFCSPGRVDKVNAESNRIIISYANVNGGARLTVSWRFDATGIWQEPVIYTRNEGEYIVSLHYFSSIKDNGPAPGLEFHYLINPGISASGAISPSQILPSGVNLDTWLGRGSTIENTRILQQWGLPVHYFCGVMPPSPPSQPSALTSLMADAFCCGLADLPRGDLRLVTNRGKSSPVIDFREDLWNHVKAGSDSIGGTFYWTVAKDYREAIRKYYADLVNAKIITPKVNSKRKNDIIRRSAFNTWGMQLSLNKHLALFDQDALEKTYAGLRKSGMKAGCFVIDAKWEENYGELMHSEKRFPGFMNFLAQLKNDGLKLGMWAAFLRCENPASMGLDSTNMLRSPDGRPVIKRGAPPAGSNGFYLLDVSQPKVQEALKKQITVFMERYKPDVIKFDFGYELPSISGAAPLNRDWAGERYLKNSLDIIVGALRKANPDVVVMYYALSPLYINDFDIHSTDDLFFNEAEFALEANRRLFFSSLLGEIGMPCYGSGGYNWIKMGDIWFDSVASGGLGSLGSFMGDPNDSKLLPADLAKFNGLSVLTRTSNRFSIQPLYSIKFGSNAARTSSWIRFENGNLVLAALRTEQIVLGGRIEAAYKDEIHSDAMVVVASMDDNSIKMTKKIGVVPFGNGMLSIKHSGTEQIAKIRSYSLGGGVSVFVKYPVKNGFLNFKMEESLANGKPVERYEIIFE